ncbi:hypothetical protein FB451DRAFT_1373726 [Mycena latifolia]|nr:hypothetical protein FB451DRAFT_1373726 [Mycena latifolia]
MTTAISEPCVYGAQPYSRADNAPDHPAAAGALGDAPARHTATRLALSRCRPGTHTVELTTSQRTRAPRAYAARLASARCGVRGGPYTGGEVYSPGGYRATNSQWWRCSALRAACSPDPASSRGAAHIFRPRPRHDFNSQLLACRFSWKRNLRAAPVFGAAHIFIVLRDGPGAPISCRLGFGCDVEQHRDDALGGPPVTPIPTVLPPLAPYQYCLHVSQLRVWTARLTSTATRSRTNRSPSHLGPAGATGDAASGPHTPSTLSPVVSLSMSALLSSLAAEFPMGAPLLKNVLRTPRAAVQLTDCSSRYNGDVALLATAIGSAPHQLIPLQVLRFGRNEANPTNDHGSMGNTAVDEHRVAATDPSLGFSVILPPISDTMISSDERGSMVVQLYTTGLMNASQMTLIFYVSTVLAVRIVQKSQDVHFSLRRLSSALTLARNALFSCNTSIGAT